MAYGKPKIPVGEIKRLILDEISQKIDQNPLFQNNSLSFYRFVCLFDLKLTVTARAEDAAHILGVANAGALPEPEKHGPEKQEPKTITAKAEGQIGKGQVVSGTKIVSAEPEGGKKKLLDKPDF
jgi:hypothetical protein